MGKYYFRLNVDDKKVDEIFARLAKAKEEIEECYTELKKLDIICLSSDEIPPQSRTGE